MFAYFGYGSNINLVSLRAKGVTPISSERGILYGWKLKFNVQHWFHHEGGVGNIERASADDKVEGMVHICQDEHLAPLDAVESYGVGYDRIIVEPETNNGTTKAWTYVGLPAFINNGLFPTQRYLNIIIKGAEAAGLSQPYIDKLRHHPIFPVKDYPEFQFPSDNGQTFTKDSLALHPYLTSISGAVFDMRGARSELASISGLLGGKDMTLFFCKRHDTSDGTETMADILNGRITTAAKKYLDAYLHEFAKEFQYAGRMEYDSI